MSSLEWKLGNIYMSKSKGPMKLIHISRQLVLISKDNSYLYGKNGKLSTSSNPDYILVKYLSKQVYPEYYL